MQTSEKEGVNLRNLTKWGVILKEILILRQKLGVKNCMILK